MDTSTTPSRAHPPSRTRALTSDEIDEILSFIQPQKGIPGDTARSVAARHKAHFRRQLEAQAVHESVIPDLRNELYRAYRTSLVQPGECVGIVAAQSIGEKQTQTTLNTFHKAGQSEKTMTVGVPRFQQLLNASKNPGLVNHCLYYTRGTHSIQALRETVGRSVVGLTIADLAERIDVRMNAPREPWYDHYEALYPDKVPIINPENHGLRITFRMEKLYEFKIDLEFVREAIEHEYTDLQCVASPLYMGIVDVYPSMETICLPDNRTAYLGHPGMYEVYLEEAVQPEIEKLYVCGIPGITEIFYARDPDAPPRRDGQDTWCVETNAFDPHQISTQYSSFKKILRLPALDATRTISNNVWDIYEVLGIEAARQFLIEEFMRIMDGINDCHARLLVDRMTHSGTVASITRYTLKKEESGVLEKASFEESMDHFVNAAARGETDITRGVSSSIFCGKRPLLGTGLSELHVDMTALTIQLKPRDP